MTLPSNPRTVLLTGTSSGLGEAAALTFLSAGWNVVATARNAVAAAGSAESSPNLLRARLDLCDVDSVQAAFDLAESRFGAVDVVVNNAGVGLGGAFEGIAPAQLREHVEVNIFGTASVCRAAIERMRLRRGGLIINVTSLAGRVGLPFLAPYCAGKFAIEGLTESLFYELRPLGIRVKLFEPGGIRTKFTHLWSKLPAYEPAVSNVEETMKLGSRRAASPAIVAKSLVMAANDPSDRLRYPTLNAATLFGARALLPDFAWRRLIRRSLSMPSK